MTVPPTSATSDQQLAALLTDPDCPYGLHWMHPPAADLYALPKSAFR
jgi:phosphatidylethanolamine-binding protein (PEBP) family uncharacterized protein